MNLKKYSTSWLLRFFLPLLAGVVLLIPGASAQVYNEARDSVTLTAGSYLRSPFYQKLFGKHYREVWHTPIKVPVMMIDTAAGGLTPYKAGGGRQTNTLRLINPDKKEYVLRSIDKTFGGALPEEFRETFVEDFIDDQVTIAHPYSALTIPGMAAAAGINHTLPRIVYIPKQPALDSFNEAFGDALYLFEQRPDENWEEADNFTNSDKIISTSNMLGKTLKDNDHIVDQEAFLRARLFDYIIGDWGRHEDQWRWAQHDSGKKKIYQAIPRDRDQAFTLFDGVLLKAAIGMGDLGHFQSFSPEVKNIHHYNFPARFLDRRLMNSLSLEQWKQIANDIQAKVTDEVIETSVKQMPPEVYPLSGEFFIRNIKARRDNLEEYATNYYRFLAKEVDVPGTESKDYFEVKRLNDEETQVAIYKISKKDEMDEHPYFSRVFKTSETEEVRLYGINGDDIFHAEGRTNRSVKVRFIGGPERDSIIDRSLVGGRSHHTHIYDNHDNVFILSGETKTSLSDGSSIHEYDYESFKYNKSGFVTGISYSNADRLYLRAGYKFINRRWRKTPYGNSQGIYLGYSIIQNAISVLYTGDFIHLVGKWNLKLDANFDAVHWSYFHGLGNETEFHGTRSFYRLRTTEFYGSAGINRYLTPKNNISLSGFYNSVSPIDDQERYYKDVVADQASLEFNHFAGARLEYIFQGINDPIIPTKGFSFTTSATYTENFRRQERSFMRYSARAQAYVPLVADFLLALNAGGATIDGTPEFYQYASIGGGQTLRGYVRDRFWGKTTFYANNELQWLPDFRSYIFNGRAGLLALYDIGRVWQPGEESDKLHSAYGAGIILAPFNKFMFSVSYAVSEENKLFHIRLNRPF